ncbi:MAG: GntR family transcriptional regulator [Ruthenibacterium sp.]
MPIPSRHTPLKKVSARTKIHSTLCEWIIDGTLQPGEKVSDTMIADYFETSRTPVREAIQLLADQRLVEIVPGKETRVTMINAHETQQVYSLLGVLHSEAVTLAYPAIDEKVLRQLQEINDNLQHSLRERETAASLQNDRDFHHVFLNLADNCFLTDSIENLLVHVMRVEYLHYANHKYKIASGDEHNRIIAALAMQDLAAAIMETKKNWMHFGLDLE